MPIAITAEQRALQASIREWATRAGTLAMVRALEPGSGPDTTGPPDSAAGRRAHGAAQPARPAHAAARPA